jgi:hypothetical protein
VTDTPLTLDAELLMALATARTGGHTNFGDPSFRPALDCMLKSIREEANMSPMGQIIFAHRVLESLSNRLTLEDYCTRHPEILSEEIKSPVLIIGLPRTGTTMLHRVLARDPRFYNMAWWEARFPSPLSAEDVVNPQLRIDAGRAEVKAMIEAIPELLAIHPLDAELPDEEVLLLEHAFMSAIDAYGNVPGYADWLFKQDQTPAYLYLKRQLQFLQWQKRQRGITADRWLLKSPHHTHLMPTLFKVFPDAHVIQTHRDPLQTIPSMGSFAYTLWRLFSDHADPVQAGRHWAAKFAGGLRNSMQFRDTQPADRFMDVWYLDAVARSMDVVERIYPFIGMALNDSTREAMQAWLAQSDREGRPAHQYSMDRMGLTEEQLKLDFAQYRERFVLPHLQASNL